MKSASAALAPSMQAGVTFVPRRQADTVHDADQRFRQAFAKAAVGFVITSLEGVILHVNQRFCLMSGYPEKELLGGTLAAITHPEDVARKLELNRCLLNGEIDDYVVEKRYVRKDGRITWAENSVSVIRNDRGAPVNMVILSKDITEARKIQEQLSQTHQRFEQQREALSALMRGGVLQAEDLAAALKAITRMTARVLGVARTSVWRLTEQRDGIVCLHLHELAAERDSAGLELHAKDFPAYFRALGSEEIIADDARADPRTSEFRQSYLDPLGITSMLDAPIHLNGTLAGVLCLEHVGPPRHWTADEQSFAVSSANLVSLVLGQWERRKIEETLLQHASLLDQAQDAILVRDPGHVITYWNKGAERLYGWTAQEALGRSIQELLYTDSTLFLEAFDVLLQEEEWTGELVQRRKDGAEVIVQGRWTLVRDAAGNPASILSINTDVTEKKRLEEQFLRAQRLESIGTLAGGIAHDLNNVLTPILMSIEMLQQRFPDAASQQTLATIASSARRGAGMIHQVLSFAKGVDGSKLPVCLHDILRDISGIVRDTFPKNIRLSVREDAGLWHIRGDATQIHQVLLNLCVNARDAMPAGGTLTLTARNLMADAQFAATHIDLHEGPHVALTVEDNGSGIAPEVLARIFDPFFTTKKPGSGTGLGLASSLAIVKAHGGSISVASEVGAGSCFSVHLPAELSSEPSAGSDTAGPSVTPRGHGELVLVIDDEEAVREITRQTLESFGYRVVVAGDGAEAASIYARRHSEIAAVLTDMMMPVMDGVATIHVLRKINPQARIIAASGVTASGGPARASEAGVSCFLSKPYTSDTMLRALHQLINAS